MSHKEVWNAVIHSRDVWPMEHPLHNLDVFVYIILACMVGLMMFGYHEWQFCRRCREGTYEYRRWLRLWKQSQKRSTCVK